MNVKHLLRAASAARFLFAAALLFVLAAGPARADCVSPAGVEGYILYNADHNVPQACDGTEWHALGQPDPAAPAGTCASPAANEADLLYNGDLNAFQFCNGQTWILMGPSNPAAANGTCSNPAAGEGTILFNRDYHVLQFCNGQDWMAFWNDPNWWWPGATLDMDFVNDRYRLNGTNYSTIASFISASGATFSRSTTATYFDSSGVLQTAATNAPRLDYDPATHDAKGVLIEESRTNNLKYSESFSTSPWTKTSAITLTANAGTAPDGSNNATLVSADGSTNSYINQGSLPSMAGQVATRTIFAKAGTAANIYFQFLDSVNCNSPSNYCVAQFNLNTGVSSWRAVQPGNGAVSMQPVGNGWYRCAASVTYSSSGSLNDFATYIANYGPGTGNVYLWGGQLEQGSFSTSYIPTTSAAVARAADVFTIPLGSWFDSTQGTFVSRSNTFDNNPYSNDHRRHVWLVSEGGFTRLSLRAAIGQFGNANVPHGVIGDGTAAYNIVPAASVAGNVFTKAALAYSASSSPGAGLSVDGAAAVASAHACTPDTSTGLLVGGATVGNQRQLTGYISRLTYFPTRQPDASLPGYTQ